MAVILCEKTKCDKKYKIKYVWKSVCRVATFYVFADLFVFFPKAPTGITYARNYFRQTDEWTTRQAHTNWSAHGMALSSGLSAVICSYWRVFRLCKKTLFSLRQKQIPMTRSYLILFWVYWPNKKCTQLSNVALTNSKQYPVMVLGSIFIYSP